MRLTLDIDGSDPETHSKALKLYDTLKAQFLRHDIEMYKTKRGYHLVVYDTGLTYEQVLQLRELLGDDKNRIKLDTELFKKPKQVLFTEKNGHQRTLIEWDWVKI